MVVVREVEMEDSHTSSYSLSLDLTNGTRLFADIDYSPVLLCIFIALLGLEDVTDWRRKNEQRKKVSLVCKSWNHLLRAQVVHLSVSPTNVQPLFKCIHTFPSLAVLNAYGSIGDTGAALLASIPQPTHFKTLDFSVNSIGGEGAESIAKALANNASLTRLDLGDNQLGDEGGVAIFKALKDKPLARLDMQDCELNFESLDCFGKMVGDMNLRSLDWSYNSIGYFGAVSLATGLKLNTTLKKLKFKSCDLAGFSAAAICEVIKVHPQISVVDVADNSFGELGANQIAEAILANPSSSLTKLNLLGNALDQGISSFGRLLASNRTITYLDLSMNHFGNLAEVTDFFAGLARNTSLKSLLLAGTNIGDTYAPALGKALAENKALTTLDISHNSIQTNIAELVRALQVNTHISSINLSKNWFGENEILALILALKSNTSIVSMNVSRCKLSPSGTTEIRQACKQVQLVGEILRPRKTS